MDTARTAMKRLVKSRQRRTLAAFGAIYILVGWIYLGTVSILRTSPNSRLSYKAHLEVMPLTAWAWLFVGCGIAALGTALAGRLTWAGFGALQVITAGWGSLFFASWAATGYDRVGAQGFIWTLLVLVLTDYARADDPREHR